MPRGVSPIPAPSVRVAPGRWGERVAHMTKTLSQRGARYAATQDASKWRPCAHRAHEPRRTHAHASPHCPWRMWRLRAGSGARVCPTYMPHGRTERLIPRVMPREARHSSSRNEALGKRASRSSNRAARGLQTPAQLPSSQRGSSRPHPTLTVHAFSHTPSRTQCDELNGGRCPSARALYRCSRSHCRRRRLTSWPCRASRWP